MERTMKSLVTVLHKTCMGSLRPWMVIGLMGITLMTGCINKVQFTITANLPPFAEQTIAIMGDTDYGFTRNKTVRIREFIDFDSPDWQRLEESAQAADELFQAIVTYSVNMVILSESSTPESQKAKALVNYLGAFEDEVTAVSQITPAQFQSMLADVRAQQKFLDALQAAQPLIDEALRYGTALLEEDEQTVNTLVIAIEQRIDDEYAQIQHFRTMLEEQQREILVGLRLLREFYQTEDPTTLQTLGQKFARLHEILRGRPPLTTDIPDIEAFLMQQLANIYTIGEQLEPDFQAWEQAHEELDHLYRAFLDDNRRAKLALTVWGRAYQKIASGVENPTEWFSLGDLLKLGTKAVESAL